MEALRGKRAEEIVLCSKEQELGTNSVLWCYTEARPGCARRGIECLVRRGAKVDFWLQTEQTLTQLAHGPIPAQLRTRGSGANLDNQGHPLE